MAKRKRKPVFDSDGSGSDNEGVSGFTKYIKEKSAKIREQISQNVDKPAFQFEGQSVKNNLQAVRQDSKSSYIKGLLDSKKQRDSDKLYLQSLKNQLHNELERTSGDHKETIITEGYQARKKEFGLASKLAEEEDLEQGDNNDFELFGSSAQGVALRLLLGKQEVETSHMASNNTGIGPPVNKSSEVPNTEEAKFENDVYITKDYDVSCSSISTSEKEITLDWNNSLKEKLVKTFLLSTKTPQEIKARLEQYKERHKND